MPAIVTVTLNPAIDSSTSAGAVVAEHKLRCEEPRLDPGGGGLNVARALAAIGGRAEAIWLSGGRRGELLGDLLSGRSLDHRPVRIAGETRENLTVCDRASGQQYRFGMPGPHVDAAGIAAVVDAVEALDPPPELLVLSGSLPRGAGDATYAEFAGRARRRGVRVVLDTHGPALLSALEVGVYLVKPNLRELSQIAEREVDSDAAIVEVSRTLIRGEAGCEVVLVSLGAGGALLVTAEACEHVPSPTVPIRSKIGAGDSMVAGMVYGLAEGWPLPDCARLAVAAGAAAVMTDGTELCRSEDVWRLYEQMAARAG